MKKTSCAAVLGGLLLAFAPQTAFAQMMPTGAEITGHAVRVDVSGVTNTVYFDPGGTARIVGADGTEVAGNWFVENQNMCLSLASGARECWAYNSMFTANQPMTLTSTCGTSTWTALSTNEPAPPPTFERGGERG